MAEIYRTSGLKAAYSMWDLAPNLICLASWVENGLI
jgi:hypothetical protein